MPLSNLIRDTTLASKIPSTGGLSRLRKAHGRKSTDRDGYARRSMLCDQRGSIVFSSHLYTAGPASDQATYRQVAVLCPRRPSSGRPQASKEAGCTAVTRP
jgi:hypothetical protein